MCIAHASSQEYEIRYDSITNSIKYNKQPDNIIVDGKFHIYSGNVEFLPSKKFYGYDGDTREERIVPKGYTDEKNPKRYNFVWNTCPPGKLQTFNLEKNDSSIYMQKFHRGEISDTVAIYESFNPQDSIHKEIILGQFSFEHYVICGGDSLVVKIRKSNSDISFNGGLYIKDDTLKEKLEIKAQDTITEIRVALPPEYEDARLCIKGNFAFGNEEFECEREINSISRTADKTANLKDSNSESEKSGTIFIVLAVIGIGIGIGIIVIICYKKGIFSKMKKFVKHDSEDEKANNDVEATKKELSDMKKKVNELNRELNEAQSEKGRFQNLLAQKDTELKNAHCKIETIKEDCKREFDKKYSALQEAKEKSDRELISSKEECRRLTNNVAVLDSDLKAANVVIATKDAAMEKFTSRITFVPFAEKYCIEIKKLINVADKIAKEAECMYNLDTIQDPWHIIKAISKYSTSVWDINLEQFFTEVQMVCSGQVVLNDTLLSKFKQDSPAAELENSLKGYFFNSYLEKYINALVVFNESLAGQHVLTAGVQASETEIFRNFRKEITEIVDSLGITVMSVKLFEDIGQKVDLQVEMGDFGEFAPGSIVEIENCIVYLTGSTKPDTKIKVKVQE